MENIIYENFYDTDQSIHLFDSTTTNSTFHFHRCIEIMYVVKGEVGIQLRNENFIGKENSIVFFNRFTPHKIWKNSPESKNYILIIPINYSEDFNNLLENRAPEPKMMDYDFNASLLPYWDSLFTEQNQSKTVTKGFVNIIFGKLYSHYPKFRIKTDTNIEIIVDILNYIDENYKENLSLDSLAQKFGYNKYYFSRLFNKVINKSITEYVNFVRIQNYINMKKNNRKHENVATLAYACGFNSLPTFYRCYEKYMMSQNK